MTRLFGRREEDSPSRNSVPTEMRLAAERAALLIEESREIVLVLDDERRVLAASRRAREALEGLREGATAAGGLAPAAGRARAARDPVRGRRQARDACSTSARPGDLAAYEELRAGFTAAVSHELRTPLTRLMILLDSVSLPGAKPGRAGRAGARARCSRSAS